MQKARKSKVSKTIGALQSKLRVVTEQGRELEQARQLLQQATQREAELIETRANELVEDLREKLSRSQADVEHLREVRGELLSSVETLRANRKVEQERAGERSERQRATISKLDGLVERVERDLRLWRNIALVLGSAAIILGGLLGNQLL